ncbi:helix-turn-helix domain-containing protein [Thalassomonas haliotis]|uniref:Helix-turn-helix domain-containing protein n=1 Tax=Thalassomonas haliotis TaxID=485448 RepID=A0ABY7VIR4_9GAMM|nr:helix-turn-helix domain-containing protein [Thalassomonas haliotis]WDE13380.1 helix-turn-helix domain-containing protein [Thalassomonas haliotis]
MMITSSEDEINQFKFQPEENFIIDDISHSLTGVFLQPHRHHFYEIVWIFEGSGSHFIDCEKYSLQPGRIYLIKPGQIHQWQKTASVNGVILLFSDALLDSTYGEMLTKNASLFSTNSERPYFTLSRQDADKLKSLASLMKDEYSQENSDWHFIRPLLSAFLYYLLRLGRKNNELSHLPQSTQAQNERLGKLLALIDSEYIRYKSVEYYADKLNITSKRLNEITKMSLGKTVGQMLHERTILEAKRYLSLSENSVKTIAHKLGFEDPSYFSRFFYRETLMSPTVFRKSIADLSR